MTINFTTYSTEKLELWVRAFTLCSQTQLLYSQKIYQNAIIELSKRNKYIDNSEVID